MQDPAGVYIHPTGADYSIKEYADTLKKVYGDKQGKQFRIWVDNVNARQLGSDTWLVKFDKWELHGMSLLCFLLFVFISFSLSFISLKIKKLHNLSIGSCGRASCHLQRNYRILLCIYSSPTEFSNLQAKSGRVLRPLPY